MPTFMPCRLFLIQIPFIAVLFEKVVVPDIWPRSDRNNACFEKVVSVRLDEKVFPATLFRVVSVKQKLLLPCAQWKWLTPCCCGSVVWRGMALIVSFLLINWFHVLTAAVYGNFRMQIDSWCKLQLHYQGSSDWFTATYLLNLMVYANLRLDVRSSTPWIILNYIV